jgi:hypothetical protein
MATKKIFKTMFEVREERAIAKTEIKIFRKSIWALLKATSYTDAQIAQELDADEAFVKLVRQEFLASQKQA